MTRNKLYYVPGLISLVGLPILLLLMDPQNPSGYCISMFLPSNKKEVPGIIVYTRDVVNRALKKKKIVQIDLNEDASAGDDRNSYLHEKRYECIIREIERLQFTNDTLSVLRIHLGYDNTYGDFVSIYNLAWLYKVRRYAYIDDDYYFFANPPVAFSYIQDMVVENPLYHPEHTEGYPDLSWRVFRQRIEDWLGFILFGIRQNRLYATGFLLLILLPAVLKFLSRFTGS